MHDPDFTRIGEETHWWSIAQVLGWIAHRRLDRIDKAYKELRDDYYGFPQLAEPWRGKPLIMDWHSPVHELDKAAHDLQRACESGALHSVGEDAASGEYREIRSIEWRGLMLFDIAGQDAGPQVYARRVGRLAATLGGAEPAFRDVCFTFDEAMRIFPAPVGTIAAPGGTRKASFTDMVEYCRSLKAVTKNAKLMDKALRARFGSLAPEMCRAVRGKADFTAARKGRTPKPK